MLSFKRYRSIKDHIVHARLRIQEKGRQMALWGTDKVKGHFACGSCAVCHLTNSKTVDMGLRTPWEQRTHMNCNSQNVVYLIKCPCSLMYIGMTSRKIKIRIGNIEATLDAAKPQQKWLLTSLQSTH